MKKNTCKCNNDTCACEKEVKTADLGYSFYSRVLNKPFDSVEELAKAEAAYYDELKAKEDKVAEKKADAKKVEDDFKALNAARKAYKEDLTALTKEYSDELAHLKKAYELGKKDIHNTLAAAEDAYSAALKEFTDKYSEGYHITLRDGDFETTISGSKSADTVKTMDSKAVSELFNMLFGW